MSIAAFALENGVLISACVLAAIAGLILAFAWEEAKLKRKHKQKIWQSYGASKKQGFDDLCVAGRGLVQAIIRFIHQQSRSISLHPHAFSFGKGIWSFGARGYEAIITKTGLSKFLTIKGFFHARALLCLGGLCSTALLGLAISPEFMIFCGVLGLVLGWRAPYWALKQERDLRKDDLEKHLSEMLEVVSLGLRSGLSFDQSFALYHEHFKTNLARESALAQQQWQLGLRIREDSLRALANTYDSIVFMRVVENIMRALRFGSSLADSFDASAFEARVLHKSHREEEVAKAPVKMLIPTAALILPAMLLLVLGPILLDMMQGF